VIETDEDPNGGILLLPAEMLDRDSVCPLLCRWNVKKSQEKVVHHMSDPALPVKVLELTPGSGSCSYGLPNVWRAS